MDHRPHAHFETEAAGCRCGAEAENQGDPHGWAPGPPDTQVSELIEGMFAEGPGGGHYENLLVPA